MSGRQSFHCNLSVFFVVSFIFLEGLKMENLCESNHKHSPLYKTVNVCPYSFLNGKNYLDCDPIDYPDLTHSKVVEAVILRDKDDFYFSGKRVKYWKHILIELAKIAEEQNKLPLDKYYIPVTKGNFDEYEMVENLSSNKIWELCYVLAKETEAKVLVHFIQYKNCLEKPQKLLFMGLNENSHI
jgi:hypothetical protein